MTTIAQSSSEAQKIVPFHDGARFVHEVASRMGVALPLSISYRIADYLLLSSSIRDVIAEILREAQERKQPLTDEFAGRYLKQRRQIKQNYPEPELVLRAVADYFRTTVEALQSRDRHGHLRAARYIASHLLREMCDLSLHKVARRLGRSDHTTVIAWFKVFEKECKSNPLILEDVKEIQRMVLQRSRLS